jgi:uncharacterized protein (DUF885 family)
MTMRFVLMAAALFGICGSAFAAESGLTAISEAFFAEQFKASPSFATAMGIHGHDGELDNVDKAAHQANVKRLQDALTKIQALDPSKMSPTERDDRAIFAGWINGQLLEERTVQMWRHNPDLYVGLGLSAVNGLVTRSFAPPAERLRLVISRERQLPRLLRDAKANLRDIPPIYIDMALENLDGAVEFLQQNIPDAFSDVGDAALKKDLAVSTKASVKAFTDFRAYLLTEKPKAHGNFAIGRDAFIGLLRADLVEATPEQVLAAGEAQLARDRAAFDKISAEIDPAHPAQAFDDIGADHPDSAHLIPTARDQLAGLRRFIEEKHIVTLPFPLAPEVKETPAFQRAMVFGEMDWPGPFETKATESYYYITPPDEKDTQAAQDKFMTLWNRPMLQNLSVHEALPGHFTQGLYLKAHPEWSMIRKAIQSYSTTEGWAHYSEQMMLDEGLSAGDVKVRLAQLSDALLRDCRLVDSIKMHVQGMSLEEATRTMLDRCAIPESEAYKEARRGTEDPGYYSYTLGKLEIQKLRQDVEKEEGASFSLQHFHDRFLGAGLVPVNIIRREILGKDGSSL